MTKKRNRQTHERHLDIYAQWIDLMKEHGEYAVNLPKKFFYNELAERNFLTPKTVSNIICNITKTHESKGARERELQEA